MYHNAVLQSENQKQTLKSHQLQLNKLQATQEDDTRFHGTEIQVNETYEAGET